jgi:hypothetical protein
MAALSMLPNPELRELSSQAEELRVKLRSALILAHKLCLVITCEPWIVVRNRTQTHFSYAELR